MKLLIIKKQMNTLIQLLNNPNDNDSNRIEDLIEKTFSDKRDDFEIKKSVSEKEYIKDNELLEVL
jgi:hypothetical protein